MILLFALADAEIRLTDLVLENEDGESVEIEEMILQVQVGWYPG